MKMSVLIQPKAMSEVQVLTVGGACVKSKVVVKTEIHNKSKLKASQGKVSAKTNQNSK